MSARRREVEMMTCATCNREKAWADGFSIRSFAQCWRCAWEEHDRNFHAPKKPRWLRRRKAAA